MKATLHSVWRRIPTEWRQQFFQTLAPLAAPRPTRAPTGGLPIGIAGLFGAASGLGEGARLGYAALEAGGLEPTGIDLSSAFAQSDLPNPPSLRPLVPGTGGTLIVHINGPYFPYAMCVLGRKQIRGRRIIGYWAWELPRLPGDWQAALRLVHEIWVPSRFTRDAVAAATDLPVHVLPHPLPEMKIASGGRAQWGLPENAVVVLNVFHLGSTFSRKNPLASVAAFRRAFGDTPDRILVIKLIDHGAAQSSRRELEDAVAGASNIRIIDRTVSSQEMAGLMSASDIVISLHRSEGFGLVPAEAMRLGKAVVATGWSGNLDFMSEKNSALVPYKMIPVEDPTHIFEDAGQQWADADVDAAAQWLKRLGDSPELRARLGAQAAADISEHAGPERFARRAAELLQAGMTV